MLLRNNYYKVYSAHYGADDALFHVALLPGCDVYRGHFPGRPVCPGACTIEMMKECVEEAVGKCVSIVFIKQCRFTSLASPDVCPELDLRLHFQVLGEGRFLLTATLSDAGITYMEFKGEIEK